MAALPHVEYMQAFPDHPLGTWGYETPAAAEAMREAIEAGTPLVQEDLSRITGIEPAPEDAET